MHTQWDAFFVFGHLMEFGDDKKDTADCVKTFLHFSQL